jgi:hypothetical protein
MESKERAILKKNTKGNIKHIPRVPPGICC